MRAGIDAFNVGRFDETVEHFQLALPLAEAQDDGSVAASRLVEAVRYYAELRRRADVVYRISPAKHLPRYQVDKSFNYVDGAYERPGPAMVVYKLRSCT